MKVVHRYNPHHVDHVSQVSKILVRRTHHILDHDQLDSINNNNFKAHRSFDNLNKKIFFLFNNNDRTNKPVLVTRADPRNGLSFLVVVYVLVSAIGVYISTKNRSMSIK